VGRGRAYRDFTTPEELEAIREQARAEGRAIRGPGRDLPADEADTRPYVIRFKGPLEGETVVEDLIKGPVTFRNKELDDLVLLRSDGAPTYNLAVVVDDHDMGVTDVIRGDDHLNNAARQTLIYQALDWPVPRFAHVPLIHGPDGAKLSKRHGAQAVGDYAELGYLPEALRNYLARLGWGHGDDELFTDAQAAAWFDVRDVVKAPARLDWAKLNHVNQHYIRHGDDARLARLTAEQLERKGQSLPADRPDALERVIPLVKEGAQTTVQLADLCVFALKSRPLALDEKTQRLLTEEAVARLDRLRERLAAEADWSPPLLELAIRRFAEAEGVGLGKIGPVLRGVLSGGAPAPDLASALAALGRDEALGRIEDAISQVR
jgi:glutamyl-tRNA synthetase